eukprot:2430069-Rhodomonas_salina.1
MPGSHRDGNLNRLRLKSSLPAGWVVVCIPSNSRWGGASNGPGQLSGFPFDYPGYPGLLRVGPGGPDRDSALSYPMGLDVESSDSYPSR